MDIVEENELDEGPLDSERIKFLLHSNQRREQDRTTRRPAVLSCPVLQDRTQLKILSCPAGQQDRGYGRTGQDRTDDLVLLFLDSF